MNKDITISIFVLLNVLIYCYTILNSYLNYKIGISKSNEGIDTTSILTFLVLRFLTNSSWYCIQFFG